MGIFNAIKKDYKGKPIIDSVKEYTISNEYPLSKSKEKYIKLAKSLNIFYETNSFKAGYYYNQYGGDFDCVFCKRNDDVFVLSDKNILMSLLEINKTTYLEKWNNADFLTFDI